MAKNFRLQLPLRLRYSITIHESQGQTLPQAIIDIGKAERAAGCTFVTRETKKDQRLQDLAVITAQHFQH